MNLTSNLQRIRGNTCLGTFVPVSLVYQAVVRVDQPEKTEVDKNHIDFVHKLFEKIILSTDSQLTSSSEFEFLSSTDPTEEGLSDREIRKRTDPELMAPIPGPESKLQEVMTYGVLKLALR